MNKPVDVDQLTEKLDSKVLEIEKVLSQLPPETMQQGGLMGGLSGISLFYMYLSRYKNSEEHLERAAELIESAFELLYQSERPFPTFAGGAAGIGWTLEHASQYGFLDIDTDEVLSQLDEFLGNYMLAEMERGNYDYLHGGLGNALYLINRHDKSSAKKYLPQMLDILEAKAIEDEHGLKWDTFVKGELEVGNYNMGLSHGIPSIMGIMARMIQADIEKERAAKILDGATRFVLANQSDVSKAGSYFPYRSDQPREQGSRLAWCYGDLGLIGTLLEVAKLTKNEELKQHTLDVLRHNSARRDPKATQVHDAGLCHGAAGNAFLFHRFYQLTDMQEAEDSALFWYDVATKMDRHEDGLAGYKAFMATLDPVWQDNYAFLEGIAGIGLCYLAYLDPSEPAWADALLIS